MFSFPMSGTLFPADLLDLIDISKDWW
jgi:hypothetical protein